MHSIVRDWRGAVLSAADRALCEFAEALSYHPAEMDEAAIKALRDAGWDDRAIHDAAQIISYFNYINRVADSLGVEPETFITPWGES